MSPDQYAFGVDLRLMYTILKTLIRVWFFGGGGLPIVICQNAENLISTRSHSNRCEILIPASIILANVVL